MSSELNFYMGEIRKFCDQRDWDQYHGPKDLAIGLVTEASELLELFRFQSEQQSQELLQSQREDIGDELADVFFFLLRFSQRFDFDLGKCLEGKMRKNALKYPVEKAQGSNKKYTEF